jgi:hypothetical protein
MIHMHSGTCHKENKVFSPAGKWIGHHIKQNKSDKESQVSHVSSHRWSMKKKKRSKSRKGDY